MPVRDNDDKRTADQPAVDAEELRRKTGSVSGTAAGRNQRSEVGKTSSSAERKGRTSSDKGRYGFSICRTVPLALFGS